MLNTSVSLIPVLVFLFVLHSLDSYKLITLRRILAVISWGAVAGLLAWVVNRWAFSLLHEKAVIYLVAPITEEALKFAGILYLVFSKRIGFLADAMIFGFASGAGFSLIENVLYLHLLEENNLMLWIIRGFGTATMHGTTTAVAAVLLQFFISRSEKIRFWTLPASLLPAILIHSFFNQPFLDPLTETLLQLICLPLVAMVVFARSERGLRNWMESQFESEFDLLQMIRMGKVRDTRAGKYILSIKENCPPELVVDMLAFIHLYVDLSIKAKGNLMMKEAGMPTVPDEELKDKLEELDYLTKNIGKTALRTLQSCIHITSVDLWQLKSLR